MFFLDLMPPMTDSHWWHQEGMWPGF